VGIVSEISYRSFQKEHQDRRVDKGNLYYEQTCDQVPYAEPT
jgi:hypothetical protein